MTISRVRPTLCLRLRTMLILVLLVGIGLGGLVLRRRAVEFDRRAVAAETSERVLARLVSQGETDAAAMNEEADILRLIGSDGTVAAANGGPRAFGAAVRRLDEKAEEMRLGVEQFRRDRDRQAFRKIKYRYAARYPFLPVWPDPPEPE